MKLIDFGVRHDEKKYIQEWSKDNNIEVKIVSELLTPETVQLAKGYDGIVAYQQLPYEEKIFDTMNEFGINVLSLRNVGVDNVPIEALKKNNIRLTNVPSYSPEAIAEYSVTGLMALLRNMKHMIRKVDAHNFQWAPDIGRELNELTVGVAGTGRIGRAAIKIYQGFGAKVIAYDKFHNPKLEKAGLYVDDLDTLLKESDVVTLHIPSLGKGHTLINRKSISEMKDNAIVVNTARGDLINTSDLYDAVASGKLYGAVMDVYENEVGIFNSDLSDQEFTDKLLEKVIKSPRFILTPHIAFYTTKAVKNMATVSLNSMVSELQTGTSENEIKFDK
ncbi:D-2-hydroxyacid dehydrogenase [Companilactobacillus alimentarius]|uniref:Lactate dehydrogenase n=1 Tax=Companilactobacillus alimentarius DSM 20249 TaxID=1423720 RepID=A0A2K9HM32_9LACO|nr:D-2-hydroxyacid dehydrogenase [Companilactobacillus alimentarius]AUI71003.1 lactate dehydrogenase [Companilactobacillus alimentarius DSM 20249]KRK75116.1 D-lactate dehydrogenase, LdhA [Companilactobacillus alimentarius DSM 20249]GEO44109.1 D-lactate dehydrogenase [Companilactobacillus alimentarius]